MPLKKQFLPEPATQPACIFLRSKRMFAAGSLDIPQDADVEEHYYCWCNQTQHVIGPDSQMVDRRSCVPGRQCYQETR
jgi:hypothetical protein